MVEVVAAANALGVENQLLKHMIDVGVLLAFLCEVYSSIPLGVHR